MLVRMKTRIGGYRNGESWPAPGGTIDLPAHEAHGLIANGYASLESDELVELDEGQAADDVAAEDENNNDEGQADDWSFGDTTGDGDEETAAQGDEDAAEHGDEEAVADEVAASPIVPTGARKGKRS